MNRLKSAGFKLFITLLLTFVTIVRIIISGSLLNPIGKPVPIAKQGIIDLRGWDFNDGGIIKLDGQWEYYKDKLLYPKDFNNSFVTVPENLILPGGYSEHGFGTYRLKVLIDDPETIYSVSIDFLQSAYRLWVNDSEVISVGKPGENKESMVPQLLPSAGFFKASSDSVYITMQVSNFYAKYGIVDTVSIGKADQVDNFKNKKLAYDLFLFGCAVMAAIYNIGLYYSRKRDKAPLYLAVVCLLIAVRTVFLGERYFIYLFPNFNYIVSGKIMHWTFYLYIPFIILFANSFYPGTISKLAVKTSIYSALIYGSLVLISPWKYYMSLIPPFEILTILLLLYLIFKISKFYINNPKSDYIAVIGVFSLLITRLNDILYEFSIIITGSFAQMGTLIFILAMCYMLAQRQSTALSNVEEMSDKLKSINRLKDDFLAITSHELKTPLNGIIGLTEGLTNHREHNLTEDERVDLALINSSAKRLSNLVEDIMVFSRLKNGEIVLQKKSINISKIAEMVLRFCEVGKQSKNIELINLIDRGVPYVCGDESRIQQILYNLVGNAMKFTNEGSITLSYIKNESFLEISVQDTGIGISPNMQDKVFEIYEQEAGISEKFGGTGLGLFISKKLVELHGGYIKVKSNPGNGSTFTFALPLDATQDLSENLTNENAENVGNFYNDENKVSDSSVENKRETTLKSKDMPKILIADDEFVNQRVLESYLGKEEYIIIKASNGKDAIEIINNTEDIDLVILDMMMPDLLGYEVITIIREKKSIFELPILIMTADNRLENLVISFECGANDYLKKPFNKHELLSRVNTLLKVKHSVKEALILAQRMTVVSKQVEYLNLQNIESNRKVDELIEYDKLKTEFFANISHELRTPLNVISSAIQLLQSLDTSKTLTEEKVRYYYNIANQNCLRLLRLINNLIDTTKIDGGYFTLNLIYGNIVSVVEDITQSVADYIKSKNIEIIFDTDTEEKFIRYDEEKIERVLLNILSNAVKFTNDNGKIFVNITDKNNIIQISVKDTGIGIPADKIDYIFQRFAQVDKSTTRRTEGSGIGLSLVKSLVEMHGGSISVKSELGNGSEFIICLPVGDVPEIYREKEVVFSEGTRERYDKSLSMEFSDIYIEK